MNDKRLLYGFLMATAALVIVGGAVWLMRSSPQEEPAPPSASAAVQGSGTVDANPFAKGEYMAPIASRAESAVADTGVFKLDGKGNLILDADTRVRLEMLISELPMNATGHELQAIERSAIAGLPQHAAQQASRILDGYMRYFKAEMALSADFAAGNTIAPEDMFNKVIALRRQHLGAPVADALFAVQEAQDRYGIQIAMMEADPKLTVQEKLARIDVLQNTLPKGAADLNSDLDASRSALLMEQGVAALRQQGASEVQVQQLRERHAGAEAAKSIGEMEVQKLDWERRQQEFLQQKNIITQMNLSEQQKLGRIEALLGQLYSEEEIPAARAYHQLPQRR